MCKKIKKQNKKTPQYVCREELCVNTSGNWGKNQLWGREGGSCLETGIELVEMAKGMSKNRRCLLFSLKLQRAPFSPES